MTVDKDCTEACAAMPRCVACGLTKKPYGRDAPMSSNFCDWDCAAYRDEPKAGHLWPEEWRAHVAGDHSACFHDAQKGGGDVG